METVRRTASRHPLAAALASVVVVLATMGVAVVLAAALTGRGAADPSVQVAGQVAGTMLVLVVLRRLGWLHTAGLTDAGDRHLWTATVIILLYTGICALVSFFGTVVVDLSVDAAGAPALLHTTLAGVVEELLFRGLVLCVLLAGWGRSRRSVVAAVVVSAVLFGGSHLANLASGTVDVTILQSTEAALSAVLYGALVVRGGSLWPAVALHSLVNLLVVTVAENTPGFAVTVDAYVTFIALQVPVFLYAAYLLVTTHAPSRPDAEPGARSSPARRAASSPTTERIRLVATTPTSSPAGSRCRTRG